MSEIPVLDLDNLQPEENYTPKPPSEFTKIIDIPQSNESVDKQISNYAQAISGLYLDIENKIYDVQRSFSSGTITIVTLPENNIEEDNERVSVIQPFSWIVSGPGSYYDPTKARIYKNCVDKWDGESSSLFQHILKLISNSCFFGYHIMVLFAIAFSIITIVLNGQRTNVKKSITMTPIYLMLIISISFDLIAIGFVAAMEMFSKDAGEPFKSNTAQKRIVSIINKSSEEIVQNLPPEIITKLSKKDDPKNYPYITGMFLLQYFYEPSLTLLEKQLKTGNNYFYSPKNVSKLNWKQFEDLLTVYKFVLEISLSTSAEDGIEELRLKSGQTLTMRNLITQGILTGRPDVHIQLLRLLNKCTLTAEERNYLIHNNPRDLSLNHYIGESEVEEIIKKLRTEISSQRKRSQNFSINDEQRILNIQFAIDHGTSSLNSQASSLRSKTLNPSRFN